MKSNHLFTSILALATIVVTSCSAPRLAQQNANDDDVYNSTAQAKVYTPVAVKPAQNTPADQYKEEDYYGTSDPYYDMDYSSRINRFYYATPWRSYYDPYFYNDWYSPYSFGFGVGIGFSPFYNNYWNSPYLGWGNLYSPFWGYNNWGYNNWGYNNWGYNNYYGGAPGGYYGGGYYGGGYYTGRTTNVPDYRPRPSVGREGAVSPRSRATYNPDGTVRSATQPRSSRETDAAASRPARTETNPPVQNRPTRAEAPAPAPARQAERPAYTPAPAPAPAPARSSGGSESGGGGSRPTRAGRG